MYIKRVIFLSFLLFSNLSYSDDNNQQLLIKDPKKVEIFSMKDINDLEKKISSSENKILLLNFWATWCAPCIKEIPELIELKKKFKNNVEVYFLSVDSNVKKTVPKFLRKNKLESILVFNDEKLKVSSKFGVKVMPTTVNYFTSIPYFVYFAGIISNEIRVNNPCMAIVHLYNKFIFTCLPHNFPWKKFLPSESFKSNFGFPQIISTTKTSPKGLNLY